MTKLHSSTAVVITTINGPEHGALPAWIDLCWRNGWPLIIVGDSRTPEADWVSMHGEGRAMFLSLRDQHETWPQLAASITVGSYGRKSLGYLYAAERLGVEYVFETDDDNWPRQSHQMEFSDALSTAVEHHYCLEARSGSDNNQRWVNVLPYFGAENGEWPRGCPPRTPAALTTPIQMTKLHSSKVPVRHFQCAEEPDLDAIQRCWYGEHHEVVSRYQPPVMLASQHWAPVNTQSTLLHLPSVLDLCYVPHTCPHRVTDILRGYVMLPALWARDQTVAFHAPVVRQRRNDHDVVADLMGELELYRHYEEWPQILGPYIANSYDMIVRKTNGPRYGQGVCTADELHSLRLWLEAAVPAMNRYDAM